MQLIPFLVKWGYPLVGYKFHYTDLQQKAEKTPATIDPEKKKLSLSFPNWAFDMPMAD